MITDLRPGTEHARFEIAQPGPAAIAGELLVGVAHDANHQLLAQELRRAHVEMKVDAIAVVGVRIF